MGYLKKDLSLPTAAASTMHGAAFALKDVQYGWKHNDGETTTPYPTKLLPAAIFAVYLLLSGSLNWISNLGSLDIMILSSFSTTIPGCKQMLWSADTANVKERTNYILNGIKKNQSIVIKSSIQPYSAILLHKRRQDTSLSETYVLPACIHGENKNQTNVPSMSLGYSQVLWYMLNVTSDIGDTCGESPNKFDKTKETTVMSKIPSSENSSTSRCNIQPHQWENEEENAYSMIWLDLTSGCVISQDIVTQKGGSEKEKFGCSSGSGSDKVSSMFDNVRTHSMLENMYGTLDEMYGPMDNAWCMLQSVYRALDTAYPAHISVMMCGYVPTEDTYVTLMRGMHDLPMESMYKLGQLCAQVSTTIASVFYRDTHKLQRNVACAVLSHVERAASLHVEDTASRYKVFMYWVRYCVSNDETMWCDDVTSAGSGRYFSPIGPIVLNGIGRRGTGPTSLDSLDQKPYGHSSRGDPRGRED